MVVGSCILKKSIIGKKGGEPHPLVPSPVREGKKRERSDRKSERV
jgi:hypothetical protein